jgi:hypothetical protein
VTTLTDLTAFEAECRLDIPLLNAMQLSFNRFEDLELTMEAPLAPNINNKGTAFGGSIASICLFGGWAVATLAFMDHDIHNTEIVVSGMTSRPASNGCRPATQNGYGWTSMSTCSTTKCAAHRCAGSTSSG